MAVCTRKEYHGLQLIRGSSSGAMLIVTNPLASIVQLSNAPAGKSVSMAMPLPTQRALSGAANGAGAVSTFADGAHAINARAASPAAGIAFLIRLPLAWRAGESTFRTLTC
jgi:hypothetical protein